MNPKPPSIEEPHQENLEPNQDPPQPTFQGNEILDQTSNQENEIEPTTNVEKKAEEGEVRRSAFLQVTLNDDQ